MHVVCKRSTFSMAGGGFKPKSMWLGCTRLWTSSPTGAPCPAFSKSLVSVRLSIPMASLLWTPQFKANSHQPNFLHSSYSCNNIVIPGSKIRSVVPWWPSLRSHTVCLLSECMSVTKTKYWGLGAAEGSRGPRAWCWGQNPLALARVS